MAEGKSEVSTTIGTPIDYYKFEVMRGLINVNESVEKYYSNEDLGYSSTTGFIRSRLINVFNLLYAFLNRKVEPEQIKIIKKHLFSEKTDDVNVLLSIFWIIQEQLDKSNITKLDNRQNFDGTRVELENKAFGD